MRTVSDGEVIRIGSCSFRFAHTLGHASHHVVILDEQSGTLLHRRYRGSAGSGFHLCRRADPAAGVRSGCLAIEPGDMRDLDRSALP